MRTVAQLLASVGAAAIAVGHIGSSLVRHRRDPDRRDRAIGLGLARLFERLGPTYLKLGQLLATRPDLLSQSTRAELARLFDSLPPVSFERVERVVAREFDATVDQLFASFDREPIASASIASVYKARLYDGTLVAVKVRRPGIERRIRTDASVLRTCASALAWLPPFRHVPVRAALDSLLSCVEAQLDFEHEADASRRLRAALVWEPSIVIPQLVDRLCGRSVLTMEFVDLEKSAKRNHVGALRAALRGLYRMIFVEGLIHCDLHQGNLHLLDDGRAVLLDFGFVANLSDKDRVRFAEFFYAFATNRGHRCAAIVLDMALAVPKRLDHDAFASEIAHLIEGGHGVDASHFQVASFVSGLFNVQRRRRVVGTTALTMAIISLLVFEGIAKDVDPTLDFQEIAKPFILRASIRADRPAELTMRG